LNPIRLIHDRQELGGTVYFELLPGPYRGKCWNEGSLFVEEDVFCLLEPTISRHHSGFDHYSFTTIGSSVWREIVIDLRQLSRTAASAKTFADLRPHVGFCFTNSDADFEADFEGNKEALARLARELATWVDSCVEEKECISILGI
jgi:hypothetical protein